MEGVFERALGSAPSVGIRDPRSEVGEPDGREGQGQGAGKGSRGLVLRRVHIWYDIFGTARLYRDDGCTMNKCCEQRYSDAKMQRCEDASKRQSVDVTM